MRKRKLLYSMLLALSGSISLSKAQTVYPYFPDTAVSSNLAPLATSVSNPATFVVDQSGDFTLEVNGTANTLIRIANGVTGYEYLPASNATIRFVKKGLTVYVYENAVYKTTISSVSVISFPTIRQQTDDSTAQTGIYSPLNLVVNPGFERRVSQGSATHFKDGIYWNAYNQSKVLDWSTGTTAAIRSVTGVRSEGAYSIIMHGTTRYLTQKLPTLTPNTYYQISYDYWTSNGAGNGGASYNILLGYSEFESNMTAISGHSTVEGDYTQKTFTGVFKTPATLTGSDAWLTLYRALSKVDWIDRVTLVATNSTTVTTGISGVTGTAYYVAGKAYAPEVTLNLAAGDYFEMTQFIINPSFELGFTGWTNNGLVSQTNTSFDPFKNGSTYLERWVSAPPVPNVSIQQTITGLPNGSYTLKLAGHNIASNTGRPGAIAYANTAVKGVTDRAEYTFDFISINGNAIIGFKTENSQGNWAAIDNFRLQYKGFITQSVKDSLQLLIDSANVLLNSKMQNSVRTALTSAISAAQQAISNAGISNASLSATYVQLQNAITNAFISIQAYQQLQQAIDSAMVVYGSGTGNGAGDLNTAIQAAQTVNGNLDATLAAINTAREDLYRALFIYRLANATGPVPTVVTNPNFARGATMAFGRSTISGLPMNSILEHGFCWSTSPSPTILDNRTTKYFSNNGFIYRLENLQPATIYYMRAYAISTNYTVGYGNVVKVITIPQGNVTYSFNSAVVNSGSATYERIVSAIQSGVYYFNNLTSIRNKHLSVSYNSGTPTAEASYSGYLQFGPNASYQRTGTALHEMGHTIGVGQHSIWYGPNSALRAGGTTGAWLGERANKVVKFIDNDTAGYMRGDATHMWPYGINGAQEDNGTELLYVANALIHQGLGEDGLPPAGGFASPAYTFYQEDTTKYYIKIENVAFGRNTTYLSENVAGQLVNKMIGNTEALLNDSSAWYLTFDPTTAYYQIRNVATGKYFTYQASGLNGYGLTATTTPSATNTFQLMPARYNTVIGTPGNSYSVKSYSIVRPVATLTPPTLGANPDGTTASVTFNNRDTASTQHWLLLTKADVDSIQRVFTIILPVTLTKFTATAIDGEVKLNWTTSSEINSLKFEIERSGDRTNFQYAGAVAASGNSATPKDYSFTDQQPNKGNNYYRLKQIDKDGKVTYSPIRLINFSILSNGLSVYPNPASSYLYVNGLAQGASYTYAIYNTSRIKVANGKLQDNKISLLKLSDALYFVEVYHNGKKEMVQKFVLKK